MRFLKKSKFGYSGINDIYYKESILKFLVQLN